MTRRVALHDWSTTPLRASSRWAPALRSNVENLLGNGFGLLLWWGPQFIQIYNDAYRPVLGDKHPASLGQPASECWPEIWPMIGPLVEKAFYEGVPAVIDDLALSPNRHGFFEETHFTIAYSPVFDDGAERGVGGVLATVHETTTKVIAERRLQLIRNLGAQTAQAAGVDDVCTTAATVLETDELDVPFALIYLIEGDEAVLCAAAGFPSLSHSLRRIEFGAASPFALERADLNGRFVVESIPAKFPELPQGPWPDPPRQLVIVPIKLADAAVGFIVMGASSRLRLDDAYLDFFDLVAGPISTAITNSRAYEAERQRAEALAELDRAKVDFFSNVSHEFRTPLTLMLGPLTELTESSNPEQRPLIDSAMGNSLRLLKLVNTLLQFSRIEAERAEGTFVETDLGAATEGLPDLALAGAATVDDAALLVLQVDEIRGSVASAVAPELVKRWRFHSSDAYSARIARQELMKFVASHTKNIDDLFASELIIGELLANTVEHAPGVVEVEINWEKDRPVITVIDSGPGMSEHDADLPLNTLNEDGRGLFLVQQFAHHINISRAPGYGTRLQAVLALHSDA